MNTEYQLPCVLKHYHLMLRSLYSTISSITNVLILVFNILVAANRGSYDFENYPAIEGTLSLLS